MWVVQCSAVCSAAWRRLVSSQHGSVGRPGPRHEIPHARAPCRPVSVCLVLKGVWGGSLEAASRKLPSAVRPPLTMGVQDRPDRPTVLAWNSPPHGIVRGRVACSCRPFTVRLCTLPYCLCRWSQQVGTGRALQAQCRSEQGESGRRWLALCP